MTTFSDVIEQAHTALGYHEGRSPNGDWNNHEKFAAEIGQKWVSDGGYPWCDIFANWCLVKAGLVPGQDMPAVSASCAVSVAGWRKLGRFSEYPALGAQVFYGPGGGTHTGIVIGFSPSTVTTIEGNTNTDGSAEGDGVYTKTHARRDAYVFGYGYPRYDKLVSADPKWKGRR
jgi:hypothetical protein